MGAKFPKNNFTVDLVGKFYFYSLGYYTCESSSKVILYHIKLFTIKQITKMVARFVVDYCKKENIQVEDSCLETLMGYHCQADMVDYFLNKFGFNVLGFDRTWSTFGWADLSNKNKNWKEYTKDEIFKDLLAEIKKLTDRRTSEEKEKGGNKE